MQIVGERAYVAGGRSGLLIGDVGDPAHPRQLGGLDLGGFVNHVAITGNTAYVSNTGIHPDPDITIGSGLQIVDISDPTHPILHQEDAAIPPDGGVLMNHDRSVTATFPPQATTTPITATYAGLFEPLHPLGAGQHAARSFVLGARNAAGQPVPATQQPYTLVISYTDAQLASANVSESDLKLVRWNGAAWQDVLPCGGCSIDMASNRVTVVTSAGGVRAGRLGGAIAAARHDHG